MTNQPVSQTYGTFWKCNDNYSNNPPVKTAVGFADDNIYRLADELNDLSIGDIVRLRNILSSNYNIELNIRHK